MKKYNLKRFLASLLAVLMLASVTGVSPAVFADSYEAPVLQNGEAVIANADVTKQVLAKALISNYDKCDPNTRDNLDWQYYCTGNRVLSLSAKDETKDDWVSIKGEERKSYGSGFSTKLFTFPSLFNNSYATYQVRIGSGTAVSFTKLEPQTLTYDDHAVTVAMPYTGADSVDYALLEQLVLDEVNKGTNYMLTRSNTDITYYATTTVGVTYHAWVPLEGGKDVWDYPAVSEGTQQVKLSFKGEGAYSAKDITLNVTFLGREASVISFKDKPTVKIQYNDDLSIKLPELKAAIWENVVADTTPADLSPANVSIKYYAKAESGSLGELGHAWADLNGEKINGLTYPAISEGKKTLRFEFAGNADYQGFSEKYVEVTFTGREAITTEIPDIAVSATFNEDLTINYDALRQSILDQVRDQINLPDNVKLDKVGFKYHFTYAVKDTVIYDKWVDFEGKEGVNIGEIHINIPAIAADNTYEVQLTWGGDSEYKPWNPTFNVEVQDNRIPTEIKFFDGASITFNMVGDEMLKAIFNNAFNMSECTLPEGITYKDFKYEYQKVTVKTNLKGEQVTETEWLPIVGDDGYPNMGAGDGQLIRVSYAGSPTHKGCSAEATINVAKADVKISVKKLVFMTAAKDDLPKDYVTLNPADERIDYYIFFVGINTNKETTVYLKLPASKTQLLDAIATAEEYLKIPENERLGAKLQEGIRIGDLREALEKINSKLDTPLAQRLFDGYMAWKGYDFTYAQFKSILDALNNVAKITDDLKLAIGTPNHAGIYQAFAFTSSDNYNTAFGTGTVIVRMNSDGMKLVKNSVFDTNGSKITVSQAKELAANKNAVILTCDKDITGTLDQDAVHCRYTGIKTAGGLYSGHDFPIEPGRYIVTASVRGGDYYALPTTFTFTVKAD